MTKAQPICPTDLYLQLGTARAPVLIDVRTALWVSGNKVEFRGEGPRQGLEGILQRQQPRK
jgi:hypothetical protein